MFYIGSLSIMGFPFLTGFFSKELIIELGPKKYIIDSNFCYLICIFSALFTSIYSCKLWLYTFSVRSINGFKSINASFNKYNIESHAFMLVSMVILCILSILIGYLFHDIIIGLGTPIWSNSIYISPNHENWANYSFIPYYIKDLPLIFAIISISFIWLFFNRSSHMHIYISIKVFINPRFFKNINNIGFMLFFLIIFTIIYSFHYIKSFI